MNGICARPDMRDRFADSVPFAVQRFIIAVGAPMVDANCAYADRVANGRLDWWLTRTHPQKSDQA